MSRRREPRGYPGVALQAEGWGNSKSKGPVCSKKEAHGKAWGEGWWGDMEETGSTCRLGQFTDSGTLEAIGGSKKWSNSPHSLTWVFKLALGGG